MPDLSAYNDNFAPGLAMTYGCQMVGMNFQNFDSNMEFYDIMFDEAGSAFVLKPDHLRFIPETIKNPPPAPTSPVRDPTAIPSITANDALNFLFTLFLMCFFFLII